MASETGSPDDELEEEATIGAEKEGVLGMPRAASDGAAIAAEEGTPAGGGVVMAAMVAEAVAAALRLAGADSVEAMAGNLGMPLQDVYNDALTTTTTAS
jgi:hypothetical protein